MFGRRLAPAGETFGRFPELGKGDLPRFGSVDPGSEQVVDLLFPFRTGAGRNGHRFEFRRREPEILLHQRRGRQRSDSDLESVRGVDPFHLPDVADQVFGTGCGPGVAAELHRIPGGGESGQKRVEVGRIGEPVAQRFLHQRPDILPDRMKSEGVGDNPVRAGRDLGEEVRVSGRRHRGRRAAQHIGVGDQCERCGAGEGLFEAVHQHRRSERSVAVDRRRGRNAQITGARHFGTALDQIVDGAAADRDRNRSGRARIHQGFDVAILRMEERFRREEVWFMGIESALQQEVLHALAGGFPGVAVGDDPGPAAWKNFGKHFRDILQRVGIQNKTFRFHAGRDGDSIHRIHLLTSCWMA